MPGVRGSGCRDNFGDLSRCGEAFDLFGLGAHEVEGRKKVKSALNGGPLRHDSSAYAFHSLRLGSMRGQCLAPLAKAGAAVVDVLFDLFQLQALVLAKHEKPALLAFLSKAIRR